MAGPVQDCTYEPSTIIVLMLGSTRLLTDDGDVTDKYSYDAWGKLLWHDRLTVSIDQPYQYVGELGYYTHYQEPEFGLLQLGVRFYDPEAGRFTQRDPWVSRTLLSYSYASDRPLRFTDAWGLYPTLVKGKSCDKIGRGSEMDAFIKKITKDYWDLIDTQFPSAGMATCNVSITVNCSTDLGECKDKNGRKFEICGRKTGPREFVISWDPACPNPVCIMLHEAIHVCAGGFLPGTWPVIKIPGCGDISAQHGRGDGAQRSH